MPWPWRRRRASEDEVRIEICSGGDLVDRPVEPSPGFLLSPLPAAEAEARLRRGEKLLRVRVQGDLDLGTEEGEPFLEIGMAGGERALLAGLPPPADFERKRLSRPVEIEDCVFEGALRCRGVVFDGPVTFSRTRFEGRVDFRQSVFLQNLTFSACSFAGTLAASDAVLWGAMSLEHCRLSLSCEFFNVMFGAGASLVRSVFLGDLNLAASRFHSPDPLTPCLRFNRAECHAAAFFSRAELAGIADFTDAFFERRAELQGASVQWIRLAGASFGWLGLTWEQIAGGKLLIGDLFAPAFEPKAVLERQDLERLFAQRLAPSLEDQQRQYSVLKSLFEKQGDFVSADACFFEWKQIERRRTRLGWSPQSWVLKAFHWINWASCGYGVLPVRTLVFALSVILLFALAYTALDPPPGAWLPALEHNVGVSVLAFMDFAGEAAPGSPAPVRALLILEGLLGWLALLLFVVTYSRIMFR